jgi:CheY-like chemotaxis protein
MLTSYRDRKLADEAKALDVIAYLVKPVRRDPLVKAILKAVGSGEYAAQVEGDRRALPHLAMQNPCKILMAEDNVVSQRVTSLLLQRLGYHVDVVSDGREAVDSFRAVDYHLVLMDCQMPNMDGFAATEAIRGLERERRHTPIIALTASALKGERERCLAAGMDDYLTKPITPEALVGALQTWVGNGKLGT